MYFRADKRVFDIGDVVTSANHFAALSPQGSQDVEDVFEKLRPTNKPKRSGSLFLFSDETAAKRHCSKMTDGKLYRAEVDPTLSRHEGDMCPVNQIFALRGDVKEVEKIASQYWAGDLTENPIIEVIISHAIISEVVSKDQQDRRAYLKSWALA